MIESSTPIRIAIAEDHHILRQGLAELIRSYPEFDMVFDAENGEEVLEKMQENPIDVLILDLNMPKMDGWEFLEEYREMNVQRQRAKVILLTTSENPDDIEKAKNYPEIQEYCNKPLTKEIIQKLMSKYYPE